MLQFRHGVIFRNKLLEFYVMEIKLSIIKETDLNLNTYDERSFNKAICLPGKPRPNDYNLDLCMYFSYTQDISNVMLFRTTTSFSQSSYPTIQSTRISKILLCRSNTPTNTYLVLKTVSISSHCDICIHKLTRDQETNDRLIRTFTQSQHIFDIEQRRFEQISPILVLYTIYLFKKDIVSLVINFQNTSKALSIYYGEPHEWVCKINVQSFDRLNFQSYSSRQTQAQNRDLLNLVQNFVLYYLCNLKRY